MSLNMTDIDFATLFGQIVDSLVVMEHQAEFELMTYKTSYSNFETDGMYSTKVDAVSRLIIISELVHANYLAFLDEDDKIILYIYKQIPEIKLNDVSNAIKRLWDHLNALEKKFESAEEKEVEPTVSIDQLTYDDAIKRLLIYTEGLVDVNHMECDVCGSTDFHEFVLCDDNKTIETQCANCFTIYRLVPSKYYMVVSRTTFNDTEKNRINPELLQNHIGG